MRGSAVWLSPDLFQRILLPKPPPGIMLTDKQLKALTKKFEELHKKDDYKARAGQHKQARQLEDQLAKEFTEIINEYLLDVVKGKSTTRPVTKGAKPAQLNKAVKRTDSTRLSKKLARTMDPTASTTDSSACSPHYPISLIDTVPHYVMRVISYKYDQSDDGNRKADAILFRNDIVRRLNAGRPHWAYQRLFGEFKLPDSQNDPFDDAELCDAMPAAKSREKVRSRIATYAGRVFVHQHRTALYSYFVLGREFRFLRWDRAGVFVTQKVDYIKDTRTFVEFFLGFLVLDDASQGIDTTATLLETGSQLYKLMDSLAKGEFKALKMRVLPFQEGDVLPEGIPVETVARVEAPPPTSEHDALETSDYHSQQSAASTSAVPLTPVETTTVLEKPREGSFVFQYVLDYFATSLAQDWPRYRVSIGGDTFLLARPIFETAGLTGRGTRGYVAWHEQSKSFVFLKDVWRPFYKGVEMEGDILQELNAAGVEHIPTLLCHGQVASQETIVSHYAQCVDQRTNEERKAESRSKVAGSSKGNKRARETQQRRHIRHYAHHRLATKEVALPVVAFKSSKQLVSIVTDCVEGHADAVTKCGLLHRDISSGNILILPTFEMAEGGTEFRVVWRGLLCDWELSKPIAQSEKDEKARQPERTGTWKYMSVASLRDVLHIVSVADEIESFFNVVLYNAVRYMPHTLEPFTSSFVERYFHGHDKLPNGDLTVGMGKVVAITHLGYLPIGNARLTFGESAEKQNTALNSLIRALLRRIKARYAVLDYEATMNPSDSGEESSAASEDEEDPQLSPRPTQRLRVERQEPDDLDVDMEAPNVSEVSPPSAADVKTAALLNNHDDIRALLRRALDTWTWPESELKSDHLTADVVVDSPLDGMSQDITAPSGSNAVPSGSLPGHKSVLSNFPLGPVRDPRIKRRSAQAARNSTTGSRSHSHSLQVAWDRSDTR